MKFAAGDSEPSFGQASSQLLHICIAVAAERAMGDNKGRPCARGTSPSPHFLSGVWSETHNTHTHEHLLLLPNMSCVCSTNRTTLCRNSIIPPLHWIWIAPAVFPCIGPVFSSKLPNSKFFFRHPHGDLNLDEIKNALRLLSVNGETNLMNLIML